MGSIEQFFPFESTSEAETMDLGDRVGQLLESGAIVALIGDLGAGKTHLVKGIARAFGVAESDVSSPTFTIAHEYRSRQASTVTLPGKPNHGKLLYHMDLYRLNTESELFEAGIEEYLQSGDTCLIEWPEKAGYLLPESTHVLRLRHIANGNRRVEYVKTIIR